MRKSGLFKCAIVALAIAGVVFPKSQMLAAEQARANAIKVVPSSTIFDVRLGTEGKFQGRVVDHSGTPIEGAKVEVKRGSTVVAQTVTDREGIYSVKNLSTGQYLVRSGSTEGSYRFWSEETAPPSAKSQGLLVMGENGARGQYGVMDMNGIIVASAVAVALAASITALVIATNAKRSADNAFHSP